MALAPLPSMAAPAKRGKRSKRAKTSTEAPAEPATDGKTIAMFRFAGAEAGADLRSSTVIAFQGEGYAVKSVALELAEASGKVKCPAGEPEGAECLKKVGEWLNNNPKTAADYLVFGGVTTGSPGSAKITVFDIKGDKVVKSFDAGLSAGDLIAPLVLPKAVVISVDENITPRTPATDEEKQIIALLDEPEKTPEEVAAEKREIEEAQAAAEKALQDQVIDTSTITADLKEDFEAFCRTGKRKKRESREDPKDLRPKCSRGPFWGYWQPRAWVALTLTSGAAIGTIAFYSAALAARGPYKDAVDAVDAFKADVGGDPGTDPTLDPNGEYVGLATEVSKTGSTMRRRAIYGDAFLGGTVLLGGVLAIIIWQDRRDAKNFIKQEKALRSVADFTVTPIVTRDTQGAGVSFRF